MPDDTQPEISMQSVSADDYVPKACTVTCVADGPLLLEGMFSIRGKHSVLIAEGESFSLCRCGQTANPPFCDRSHRQAPSADSVHQHPDPVDLPGGPAVKATVRVLPNGPYLINEKILLDVCGQVNEASGVALCRCGASKRKPFCDGSHRLQKLHNP